jgi:hypothetical protein
MRNIEIATFNLSEFVAVGSSVPIVVGRIDLIDHVVVQGSRFSVLGRGRIKIFYEAMIEEILEAMKVFKDPESKLAFAKDLSYLMSKCKNI